MNYLENQNDCVRVYGDDHLKVDFERGMVLLDSKEMKLTRKERELFLLLVANTGEIIPRNVLLFSVWGYCNEIRTRTLDLHIRRLRKKLGQYGERYIETIFGVGYCFQRFRELRTLSQFVPLFAPVAA